MSRSPLVPYSRPAFLACQVLVGALFILSGWIKTNDALGFSYKLEEYFAVFEARLFGIPFGALNPTALAQAMGIAILEVVLGVLLLLGLFGRTTTWTLMVLIVFFTFLTGWSAITGSVTDCGCFGDAVKLTPWQSFLKDVILLGLIGYLFIHRGQLQPTLPRRVGMALAAVVAVGITVYTFHALYHLPPVDFRPYKVGANLGQQAFTWDEEGNPGLKDYFPIDPECGYSEFEGPVLWLVAYNLADALPQEIEAMDALARQAQQAGYRVYLQTAATTAEFDAFKAQYQPPYCAMQRDATMLKTVIRANPGYVLLVDGVVRGKWHANDRPTVAELDDKAGR